MPSLKIIIAPNAFKGSLTAPQAAQHIRAGVMRAAPDAECLELPIADGGDGTLDLVLAAAGGERVHIDVTGPLGEPVRAELGLLADDHTAVIEMASASGLRLLALDQLDPMRATTYGTGELIRAALDRGRKRIIIGVGGSATVDGGLGMAAALGIRPLKANGEVAAGGAGLAALEHIDMTGLDSRIAEAEIIVSCDVENPLTGPEGAAPVFAPQKGATAEMVEALSVGMENYAHIVERATGRAVADLSGAGAAGGLGAGLYALLGARIESGAEVLLDLMNMDAHLRGAHLVITAEGRIDGQTVYGKAPAGVAKAAGRAGIPVIGIAGCLADDADAVYAHGIDGLMASVCCPMTLDAALKDAGPLLEAAAERALRLVLIGQRLG